MTGGLVEALLAELVFISGKAGLKKLFEEPAVEQAVNDTAIALTEIEAAPALAKWMASRAFSSFVTAVQDGQRSITREDAAAFIIASDFPREGDASAYATQVLGTFLRCLVRRLHEHDGLTVVEKHAERLFVRHEENEEQRYAKVMAAILEQHLPSIPPSADASRPEPGEEAYAGRLDEARTLLKAGKFETAEGILLRLDDNLLEAQGSSSLRARVAVNIGVCRLQQGDADEAERRFHQGLALRPGFSKALNGLALLCLTTGRLVEAVEHSAQSLEADPADADADAIRLVSLAASGRQSEVDAILSDSEWSRDSPVRTLALGEVLYRRERYEEAAATLRRAVALNPDEPQAHMLLALSIFVPIQARLRHDLPLPWRIPMALTQALDEAVASLSNAIEILERYEAKPRLLDALSQRGAILASMSRDAEALADFDRVLVAEGSFAAVVRNKGLLLFQQGRYVDAEGYLKRAETLDPELAAGVPLALCSLALGHPTEAAGRLESLWNPDSLDLDQINIGALLLRAYDAEGRHQKADDIESEMASMWPGHPQVLAAMADRRGRRGDHEGAIGLLLESLANSTEATSDTPKLQLADEYAEAERWADAAELYAEVADASRNNPILRRYVASLFNAGRYADARAVAVAFREGSGSVPAITEVEARVEEYIGNLEHAIDLYLELDVQDPGDPRYRILAALLCVQHGDHDKALELIRTVSPQDAWREPTVLMQLAQLRHELGEPDALPLAYQARRLGMDDPNIHMAYVHLMLSHEEELPKVQVVAVDTTVVLARDGETHTFTILDDSSASRERNEISAGESLATQLLGKGIGDQLVSGQGTPRGPIFEIAEIKDKYVAAFQETVTKFNVWFPEHSGLQRVDAKDGDLSELLLTIDRSDERSRLILDLYLKGPLTLGSVAQLSGRTEVEAWGGMTGEADARLLVSSGSLDELQHEAHLLVDAQGLVLDLTGALTIAMLGLTEQLARSYRHLYVSQGTIDEVNRALHARFGLRRAAMTVGKEGGRYVRQEITIESYDNGKRFLEDLRSFLVTRCETVPYASVLDMEAERYEKLRELFGEATITSILIAGGLDGILYCDDEPLKGVAKAVSNVRCVSIQAVLHNMQRREKLSRVEYSAAIEKLMLAQYRHLAVSVNDIVWALEEASMSMSPGVLSLFSALHGPVCSEDSAVQVACGVLQSVWGRPIPMPSKMLILDLALTAVMTNRSPSGVAERLKSELRRRFAAAPQALPVIFETIHLWVRHRRFGGRI